jgi:hypothetical protein
MAAAAAAAGGTSGRWSNVWLRLSVHNEISWSSNCAHVSKSRNNRSPEL